MVEPQLCLILALVLEHAAEVIERARVVLRVAELVDASDSTRVGQDGETLEELALAQGAQEAQLLADADQIGREESLLRERVEVHLVRRADVEPLLVPLAQLVHLCDELGEGALVAVLGAEIQQLVDFLVLGGARRFCRHTQTKRKQ